MKKTISILLATIPLISFAQNKEYIFDYLKYGVKTVIESKWEKANYEYKEGLIIESLNYPYEIERRYYYSRTGDLDSIVYSEMYHDTLTVVGREIHSYDENNKLSEVRYEFGVYISVDSFVYDTNNLVDSVFHFRNSRGFMQPEILDSLIFYTYYHYEYDDSLRLIRKESNFGRKEIKYFYDNDGNISRTIEYLGHLRHGCFVKEEKIYSTSDFTYNEIGLPVKEISKEHKVFPNGKKKKNGKYKFKTKYEFY